MGVLAVVRAPGAAAGRKPGEKEERGAGDAKESVERERERERKWVVPWLGGTGEREANPTKKEAQREPERGKEPEG